MLQFIYMGDYPLFHKIDPETRGERSEKMDSVNQIWDRVLEYIRNSDISEIAYNVYIKCMEPRDIEDGEMVVTVKNDWLKKTILDLYSEKLLEALRVTLGIPLGLRIVSQEAAAGDPGAQGGYYDADYQVVDEDQNN